HVLMEELPHRVAHLHFVNARPHDGAGDGEEFGAGAFLRADLFVGGGAVLDDVGDGGQGFDVVDDGGTPEKPFDGGEGRLDARVAAVAFQGIQQGGFLAADVGAGAAVDVEI